MNRVRSGDVSLHYRKLGENRALTPILVVHGLSYFSYDWLEAGSALAAEREVVLMDMRGFGDSDWSPSKDYAVPTMGEDIVRVLEDAGLKRALLVGHSMGARSTTYAAARHPGRVAGLVLVDYTPENAPAGAKRTAQSVANVPERFKDVEEAMRYFNSTDRARFEAYLKPVEGGFVLKRDKYFQKIFQSEQRPVLGVDMWALLAEVRCPILSLRGTRSDMYAPETVEKMKAANARVQVVEVDAGHNVAAENPQGFLSAMRSFILKVEGKSHEPPGH